MKKLSIITINYNDAKGLHKTIESIKCQSYKNFQYIVIDGNSSDGSKDVILQHKEFIDVAISEPDKGIYNAMNKGASKAIGEYLLFINSGDELYNEHTLSYIFSHSFNEDIVSGNTLNYSTDISINEIPPKDISLYSFVSGSLPHCSTLIKNSLFIKLKGYRENYNIISDWCFFVEALIKNECTYKTLPLIIARFNLYGISSTSPKKEEIEKHLFLEELFGRRVIKDYLTANEECLSNCAYWISSQKGLLKGLLIFPFRVMNRLLRLRNNMGKRVGIALIKS